MILARRSFSLGLALFGALAVWGGQSPAQAHRGHASLSVVEFSDDGKSVVVTHVFSAHDVEPALVALAPDAQPSLDDPDAFIALVAHAGTAFGVWTAGGRVALDFTGEAFEGDRVTLVFKGTVPSEKAKVPKGKTAKSGPLSTVKVQANFFSQTHKDQHSQVNVRYRKVTRTVHFHGSDAPKAVTF
mgnify:CR=1 FL=1